MRRAIVLLLLLVAASTAVGTATARPERFELQVLHELNVVRNVNGVPPLRLNQQLAAAAALHTREMIRNGYFAHESPDGRPFWERIKLRYTQGRYKFWSAGENLVWASPTLGAEQAVDMWLKSPRHRELMLDPKWREVGLSAVEAKSAPGIFSGLDVTVLTADFGVRH